MAFTDLTTARQLLGDLVGDFINGTCSANGTTTTLVDTDLQSESANEDDYFNDEWIMVTATAGTVNQAVVGQERRISDFAAAGTVSVYTAWSGTLTPLANDSYEISKIWRPSEKRRALNWAIRRAYPYIARNIIDTNITTQTETFSYRLGDYGTNTAIAAGTLTDTAKSWITNQFAGYIVQSGGNSASVASNTATVLTLSANWSPATPASGDEYSVIHPCKDIYEVEHEWNTSNASYPYRQVPFAVFEHEGTRTLQLDPGLAPPDDRTLRIRGRGYLSDFTSSETSAIEIEENELEGILFLAAHFLFRRTPALSASQDRDFYREEANRYLAMWEGLKETLAVNRFPQKIWAPGMALRGGRTDLSELALYDTPGTS